MSAQEIFLEEPTVSQSQNIEAEMCLLGSALMSALAAKWLQTHAVPNWFFSAHHREICSAIVKLGSAKIAVDIVTLNAQLESQGSRISQDYLLQCVEAVGSPTMHASYGAIVSHHWRKRTVANRLKKALEKLESIELNELDGFITKASRISDGLMWFGNSVSELKDIPLTENGAEGLMIGFEQIDYRTSCRGIPKGHVTLIVAPKKVGKTTFALQWFANLAQTETAAFISLEMGRGPVKRKLMQQRCGQWRTPELNQAELYEKPLPLKEWEAALAELDSWTGAVIFEPKGSERTCEYICGWIEDRHRTAPCSAYFLDYAQLLKSEHGNQFRSNRVQELEYISGMLKDTAATIGAPVVLLAQSSDQKATDSMEIEVKGCRAFEQDCGLMIALARKDYIFNAAIRANRFGQSDIEVKLNWNRKHVLFEEALRLEHGKWVEA